MCSGRRGWLFVGKKKKTFGFSYLLCYAEIRLERCKTFRSFRIQAPATKLVTFPSPITCLEQLIQCRFCSFYIKMELKKPLQNSWAVWKIDAVSLVVSSAFCYGKSGLFFAESKISLVMRHLRKEGGKKRKHSAAVAEGFHDN